jgi:hypothetical protein
MGDVKSVAEWFRLSRSEKLANVMYPAHASESTKRVMNQLAAREGKKGPMVQSGTAKGRKW